MEQRCVATVELYGLKSGQTIATAKLNGDGWIVEVWMRKSTKPCIEGPKPASPISSRKVSDESAARAALVDAGAQRIIRVPVYSVIGIPESWSQGDTTASR